MKINKVYKVEVRGSIHNLIACAEDIGEVVAEYMYEKIKPIIIVDLPDIGTADSLLVFQLLETLREARIMFDHDIILRV